MSGKIEIKPGMYAEDISEEERQARYTLTEQDISEMVHDLLRFVTE
jgi:hypothetical protein